MFKVFNRKKNQVDLLENPISPVIVNELGGIGELSFSVPSTYKHLELEGYIQVENDHEYVIKEIVTHGTNREVVCTLNIEEILGMAWSKFISRENTLMKCAELVLSGTGWRAINKSSCTVSRNLYGTVTNSYNLLQMMCTVYNVEFVFDTFAKTVTFVDKVGKDAGVYFINDINLKQLNIDTHTHKYITRVIPIGKEGLTIESVNGGKNYLENKTYSNKNIYGIWQSDKHDNPSALKADAQRFLDEMAIPYETYEVLVDDLYALRGIESFKYELGDVVTIIDGETETRIQQRVIQRTYNLLEPDKDTIHIANKDATFEDYYKRLQTIADMTQSVIGSDGTISGGSISDGTVSGDKLQSDSITSNHIKAEQILADHIMANQITSNHILANNITANHIQSNTIDTKHLKANIIDAEHIKTNSITTNHLQANSITSGHIQTGSITAGSGIIADGAIGNAQISKIDAGKIEAGTIDTSKVTIQGVNGHLRLKGNRMQVFDGIGNNAKERVSVGDVNGDGTVFGLRVRGKDGTTVLLDENGVTSEGITDGSITNNKISDNANIDGAKLNINSVVNHINKDGTEVIKGTKIDIDGTNLGVKLSEITNKQTQDSNKITQAQSQITANTNAIKLKVDEQTYTTDKNNMTSKLEKNTSDISAMKGQIALKVEKTDITNAINNLSIGSSNLFRHSDFSKDKVLDNWYAYPNTSHTIRVSTYTGGSGLPEDAHISGKKVLRSSIDIAKAIANNATFGGMNLVTAQRTLILEPNTEYTLSYWVYKGGSCKSTHATIWTDEGLGNDVSVGKTTAITEYTGCFVRSNLTFTTTDVTKYYIRFYQHFNTELTSGESVIYLYQPTLTKGNKVVDWSPSPEDVTNEIDTKISSVKSEINVTTDKISQTVSNLSQTVSTKADNSVVTSINNKVGSLETSINGISGTVSSLEKTTTTLGTQVSDAQSTANNAVNKANTAQSTANTNKNNITNLQGEVTTVKNSVASLEVTTSGISQNVSSLSNTVSTKADGSKVNSLESSVSSLQTSVDGILGRVSSVESTSIENFNNLLINSNIKASTAGWRLTNLTYGTSLRNSITTHSAPDRHAILLGDMSDLTAQVRYMDSTKFVVHSGEKISMSLRGMATEYTESLQVYLLFTDNTSPIETDNTFFSGYKSISISGAWKSYTLTATAPDNATRCFVRIRHVSKEKPSTTENNRGALCSIMVNRGDKYPTWTANTEDNFRYHEDRISTAESKITDTAITNTVKKSFYTKTETDNAITSKGYQTSSQVQQTVDALKIKFQESGGYNLLYNGDFSRGGACWSIGNGGSGTTFRQTGLSCPNGKGVVLKGAIDEYVQVNQYLYDLHLGTSPLTISYYTYTSSTGTDGTTRPYRTCEVALTYEDGTQSWHGIPTVTEFNKWERKTATIRPSKPVKAVSVGLYARDTSKVVYYSSVVLEVGEIAHEWTPNPNEAYGGITTIDRDGIRVSSTSSNTHTEMDADSFRVVNNSGGTIAEFAQTSTIPILNSGTINAQEIYANNLVTKSNVGRTYTVNGSTGVDSPTSTVFRTVQYVLDNFIEDVLDANVRINVSNSVQGWSCTSRSGKGELLFYLEDNCIVSSIIHLTGCSNAVRVAGNSTNRKATLKEGITINNCPNFDVGWLTFRGKNWSHSRGSCCVLATYGSRGIIRVNDFNGVDYGILVDSNSEIWCYNNKGSNVSNYIGISAYTKVNMMAKGTDVCPDYTYNMYSDAGHANLYYIRDGATFTKTPSVGWSPTYTPTQKTQTWSFNKIWSDETLHGWSDRQELIQGYSSTWNTGRWTGYMQMTDGMSAIRSTISGGTNLSGRIYVQRTSSSGNSTGSKLCLYASDGTLITNSTTINRGQGVWVSLSSAIIQKIQSGAITYFYLKADANNDSTYFKCQSNAKIEITYTK